MLNTQTNSNATFVGLKWFLWLPLFVLADQIPKWLILNNFSLYEVKKVLPGFQLTLAYNPGVAFSLFGNHQLAGFIALISFVSLICLYIAWMLAKTPLSQRATGWPLVLILGGALGNLLDRIVHGHVIDFIDLSVKNWHWYTFNVADCFVTVGAFFLVLQLLFGKEG